MLHVDAAIQGPDYGKYQKCTVLQCYKTNSRIFANYSLAGQILDCVEEHSYLGIVLDQQMTFTLHINHIVLMPL